MSADRTSAVRRSMRSSTCAAPLRARRTGPQRPSFAAHGTAVALALRRAVSQADHVIPPVSGLGHWNQRLATHPSQGEVTDFRIASTAAEACSQQLWDIPRWARCSLPTHLEGGASKIIRCQERPQGRPARHIDHCRPIRVASIVAPSSQCAACTVSCAMESLTGDMCSVVIDAQNSKNIQAAHRPAIPSSLQWCRPRLVQNGTETR